MGKKEKATTWDGTMRGVIDIVTKRVRFEDSDCHYLSPTK